jgi:hypothetical protein
MSELEVVHNAALLVDNHHIVVILGPIKAGEMSDLIPRFHTELPFGCSHRGAVFSRPDTGSLKGCCSLRLFDSRRRAVR